MGGFVFVRAKSKGVTNPLDEDAKERIIGTATAASGRTVRSAGQNQQHRHLFGYVSSGSEHYGDSAADDSPCLSKLVHGFLHEDDEEVKDSRNFFTYDSDSDSDAERVDSANDRMESIEESVREALLARGADSFRDVLTLHVSRAVEAFSCLKQNKNKPLLGRKVMSSLREMGYNAAICKTRWDSSGGGLTAGNYEFIDVVQSLPSATRQQQTRRYVIDLEFAGEFEIARPTAQYSKLVGLLPGVFVARNEDLKKIVRAMCDAAKRSLKSRGLSLPPWRKSRYMINKWLGPYRRTANPLPESTPISSVKCRTVGFDECMNGGPIAVVRTR